jgi:hypothetical protein
MARKMIVSYVYRTKLNREAAATLQYLSGKQFSKEMFMLTANSEAKLRDDNEWQGFVQSIKTFIKSENFNLN